MDEYEDLATYSCDTIHDMNVDFDRYENIGEHCYFEDDDLDDYVNSLNDWV